MSWRVDLIRQHIEVENRHLMDEMLETLASEDPVRDEVAGQVYRGREAVAARYAELWRAFPDFNVSPLRYVEQGDIVVMEADYTGTHVGRYLGHEGTGKKFQLRLVNIFAFDTTHIASETIYIDLATQLRQLGLTPR